MDPTHQGAAALEPLLQRALGDPSLAAFGRDELDRIIKATEIVVAEVTAESRGYAERERSAIRLRSDQAIAHRRLELQGIRSELMDRATALAIRFEALLDEVDSAEAELAQMGVAGPSEAAPEIAAPSMGIGDGAGNPLSRVNEQQSAVFAHTRAPDPFAGDGPVGRRRWWHRWRGQAA